MQKEKAKGVTQASSGLNSHDIYDTSIAKPVLKKVVYKPADLNKIVAGLNYLTADKRPLLLDTLSKYPNIFKGKCGDWKGEEVSIRLKPGSKPYYAWAYLIPISQREATEMEIQCQCDIGALQPLTTKEAKLNKWAFPTFGVPKKNVPIQIVAHLCKLNCMLGHAEFHIPTIDNTLTQIQGFKYATAIDLNMGYMALRLDTHDRSILQIIFPFGINEYQVLPMGVKPAKNLFQS